MTVRSGTALGYYSPRSPYGSDGLQSSRKFRKQHALPCASHTSNKKKRSHKKSGPCKGFILTITYLTGPLKKRELSRRRLPRHGETTISSGEMTISDLLLMNSFFMGRPCRPTLPTAPHFLFLFSMKKKTWKKKTNERNGKKEG